MLSPRPVFEIEIVSSIETDSNFNSTQSEQNYRRKLASEIMLRCSVKLLKNGKGLKYYSTKSVNPNKVSTIPESADVVIIGKFVDVQFASKQNLIPIFRKVVEVLDAKHCSICRSAA